MVRIRRAQGDETKQNRDVTNLYICTVVCRYEEEESGYREMKQTDSGQGEKQMDKEKKTTDGDMKQKGKKKKQMDKK